MLRALAYAIAVLLLTAPYNGATAQGRPAVVGVDAVDVRQAAETVVVFGEVVAARESSVAARVGGLVNQVLVQAGDSVREGDVIARLDQQLLSIDRQQALAQIAIAEAGIRVADARRAQAQRAFDRAERLAASSTIARGQVEDRESELATSLGALAEAEARLLAARVTLDRADYNLTNSEIVAPFDGTVLSVATEIGQFITTGAEVALLLDDDHLEVEANVPSVYVDAITGESVVQARTDSGASLQLTVRAILPVESSATRTRPVLFEAGGAGASAVGASVTLDLPISAPREVVTVSKDALVQARGGWSVFVNRDGKAVPATVEVGVAIGDRLEVLSGLQPGDSVVVRGNERLRPMQDIMPAGAGGPPGGGRPGAGGPPAEGAQNGGGRPPQGEQRAEATN